MSGEAHPKELDETWDSQIFHFSKMFPLKTKFFLLPSAVVYPPLCTRALICCTFLVCTFLQM
jgi:hypothetical protein